LKTGKWEMRNRREGEKGKGEEQKNGEEKKEGKKRNKEKLGLSDKISFNRQPVNRQPTPKTHDLKYDTPKISYSL